VGGASAAGLVQILVSTVHCLPVRTVAEKQCGECRDTALAVLHRNHNSFYPAQREFGYHMVEYFILTLRI
jgi:bacterioferritin-associated ferredoxin